MRTYEPFDDAREARHETLSSVAHLDQAGSELRPSAQSWSAGEVLDHLLKLDRLIVRELEVAIEQRRRGLPFVYRSVADIDTTLPWVLRPVLPFLELPFGLFNAVVPLSLRKAFTGDRRIPLRAPGVLRPRFGRSVETLRAELGRTFETLAGQQEEAVEIDLERAFYYNPITGLSSVAGLYGFIASHERRHQGQLREILDFLQTRPAEPAADRHRGEARPLRE